MPMQIPNIKKFVSRPKVYFNSIQISDSDSEQTFHLDSDHFYIALHEIYPDSTLLELFKILEFFTQTQKPIDKFKLAQAYSFFWNDTTEVLFEQYNLWPTNFKTWAQNKKAHINDLRALVLLSKLSPENQKSVLLFIDNFDQFKFSLHEGKKALELYIDILVSSPLEYIHLGEEILNLNLNSDQILKKLLKLRYPLSTKNDEKKQTFINSTSWPTLLKVQLHRQGDQSGFEVTAMISQHGHIEKSLKAFKDGCQKIETFFISQNFELTPNRETQNAKH